MGKRLTRFLSTLMFMSVLSGFTSCVEHQEVGPVAKGYSDWNSSNAQIMKISEALGADNDRIVSYNPDKNNCAIRLAHNNGEPIEVAFDPSFSGLEQYAIDSLDYLFGIMGSINENYKYEIVDFEGAHEHNIVFQAKETSDKYSGTTSISSRSADDGVHNIEWGMVTIYKDSLESSTNSPKEVEINLRNTITHEIMHVLGFDDVYPSLTDMHVGNTLLHTSSKHANEFAKLHITPNDYKNFIALYAKPSADLNSDIEKYKAMSDAYAEFYYHNWLLSEFEKENPLIEELPNEETYTFTQNAYLHDTKGEDINFSLDVQGDKYYLKVTSKAGAVLEEVSGDVSYYSISIDVGGTSIVIPKAVMVIEKFESEYYFTNRYMKETIKEGSTSSLMVYKSKGKYVVKDIFSMVTNNANELEIQNQMQ